MNIRYIHHRKKQKVFERDGFKCVSCGKSNEYAQLEADHIIPVVEGGTNDIDNLQTLCYECNMAKEYAKLPDKGVGINESCPIIKLELIKNKIREYSGLTWDELKVIYVLDPFFRMMRVPRDDIYGIYMQILGKDEKRKCPSGNSLKYKEQRDILIKEYKKLTKLSIRDLSKDFKSMGFNISHVQLTTIINKKKSD